LEENDDDENAQQHPTSPAVDNNPLPPPTVPTTTSTVTLQNKTAPQPLDNSCDETASVFYAELSCAAAAEEAEEDHDDTTIEEEERFFIEERFFTKTLNRKFVARGFKRPPETWRLPTRRTYQNFRNAKKEDKRKIEKFRYMNSKSPEDQNEQWNVAIRGNPISTTSTSCPPSSTTTAAKDPVPPDARYLSVNQEREYQDALRQTSAVLAPSTGISLQQMLDMLNRDLTPEDYELLLRLDEAVEKKTVKQETLTTLAERKIEDEGLLSEICTVCMFNYEMGDNVKELPCKHFFHVDCIVPYLSSYGQACPVCKAKV